MTMLTKDVTLSPGESKIVPFEVIPTEARVHSVNVDGLTGSFEAVSPEVPVTNLYGHISDAETGSAITEVKVSLDSLVFYSDPYGNYMFEGVEIGSYTLTFEKAGYEPVVMDKVLLDMSETFPYYNWENIQMVPLAPPPLPTDYLLMGKDELYSYLINGSVSRDWWLISYADRKQLGLKIINWWSVQWFGYPLARAWGEPQCAGAPDVSPSNVPSDMLICKPCGMEQESALRYCLFTDHTISPTDIYWFRKADDKWYCHSKGVSFGLPTAVTVGSGDFLNALQIGEDVGQLDSWIFFQIDYNDIKPGGWRWPATGWSIGILEIVGVTNRGVVELGRRIADIWDGGSITY